MSITLSKEEAEVLKEAAISENKANLLELELLSNGRFCLKGSEEVISDLRECCGEYLQIVGFDINYEPTSKGKILEYLIDKLDQD